MREQATTTSGDYAIVVPVWRAEVDAREVTRIHHTHGFRGPATFHFVGPKSMDYSLYRKLWPSSNIVVFDDEHFSDIRAYSNWLLTTEL